MGYLYKLFGRYNEKGDEEYANVKTAIVYYSSGGTNYQLAQWAAEAAKEAGSEVRLVKVAETAPQAAIDATPRLESEC